MWLADLPMILSHPAVSHGADCIRMRACGVHLIRAAMRFVRYQDRKRVAAALKPIYTAVNADTALEELEALEGSELGAKYPTATPPTPSSPLTTSSGRSSRTAITSPTTPPP